MSADTTELQPAGPGHDCVLCPRLVDFRMAQRVAHSDWHNAPVPSFGDIAARLLIVGLAPGLKGANRTGRPFTGDYAGDLLYATLKKFGFAGGDYARHKDDGLTLIDCRISNATRCVPPENKPTPEEVVTCRQFLIAEIAAMPKLRAILALGQIAHGAVLVRARPAEIGLPLRPRRGLRSARRQAPGRQLSLLALQHQHRQADNRDVRSRVQRAAETSARSPRRCARA